MNYLNPSEYIYDIFFSLIIATIFIIILYTIVPLNHYNLYLMKK